MADDSSPQDKYEKANDTSNDVETRMEGVAQILKAKVHGPNGPAWTTFNESAAYIEKVLEGEPIYTEDNPQPETKDLIEELEAKVDGWESSDNVLEANEPKQYGKRECAQELREVIEQYD